ncbi:unnamed protein product [Calypogeia fissa]
MQAPTAPIHQSQPALVRSSLDIRRLSKCSNGRNSPKQEVLIVTNGNRQLQKSLDTPPLQAQSSSSVQNQTRWQFLDMEFGVTSAVNFPQFSLPVFSIERLMDTQMGFQKWVAGMCIASSVLVFPVEAAEVLSLAMLDSESTTGPITGYLLSRQEQRARDDFSDRVSEAVEWLEKGQLAQARGDFSAALDCFSEVTEKAGDLALAEYARVGHAVTLYEVGDRGQAIIEMEDVSISMKGYPEIHAALAAALYADKHAPIPAEKQFTIATLLDPRYTDLVWVQEAKHWPPSLLKSLQKFISLT